jgi:uncharacterized LabA/DUF88 family protein
LTDTRLKIAVFIDFDNIEIGVKTTLGGQFDIGTILEAIKERGEVVTKVAYGDWKRAAGDHSRQLSQHAIRMVQRNLTPGGDKNGADINLALDALEMAFTHDHINAFVIVGGDSDFITLVEKLKQYDRKVFVVGGRQFTSLVMQKNCHEFIAYENLIGTRRGGGGRARGTAGSSPPADLDKALPLIKRALKVLSDREVTPQLGLLKSTLLQLDSTFSERDYGASTFRDFIEKVAERGIVSLRQTGRSVLVELAPTGAAANIPDLTPAAAADASERPVESAASSGAGEVAAEPPRAGDAVQAAARIFASAAVPRWPMYIRQVRQFLRGQDEGFDERKFGYTGIVEFLRACQRDGLLRLERDRQGILRVFPGTEFPQSTAPTDTDAIVSTEAAPGEAAEPVEAEPVLDEVSEPPVIDAEAVAAGTDDEDLSVGPGNEATPENEPKPRARRARKTAAPARSTATRKTTTRKRTTRKKKED